jgi:hypothetical protein
LVGHRSLTVGLRLFRAFLVEVVRREPIVLETLDITVEEIEGCAPGEAPRGTEHVDRQA